jgi:glycosyltransferase involved in cell wall biosynthesis
MRILHVIPSVGPLRGGPSAAIRTMTRGLAQAGLSVHVATTDDNGPDRLSVSHRTPVDEQGVIHWYFPRQTRFYTFSLALTQWLRRHVADFDLVHIHALFSYAALPAAYWASRRGVPYIVRPLGVLNCWGMENRRAWMKNLSFRLIERRILAGAAAVHFTSEQERMEAVEVGWQQRAVVIPNATDAAFDSEGCPPGRFRARHPQLSGRPLMLFLSRLDKIKGLDILLPAFAQVRAQHPRAMLVLAGDGDPHFVAHLRQKADQLGIAADVFWPGFLAGEDKWAALADADLFVLPSYSENFGMAVVEAMACARAVVVSDRVAIHREIAEAQAGLVVPCEIDAIARALKTALTDCDLRARMGRNGKQLAQSRFSVQAVTKDLIDLYTEVTNFPVRKSSVKPLVKEAV